MSSVTGWLEDAWEAIAGATAGGDWRKFVPLGIAGLLVWSLWLYRVILSRLDRPVINGFRTTVSVVVPSYREDPEILMRCLDSWLAQDPTEVIIVVDVADEEAHHRLAEVTDPRLQVLIYEHAGKRSALGVGIRAARCELVVFADSDTWWRPGLLDAVQMPFEDPQVGGVGTQQNVYQRTTSVWRRIADWLVNLRYYDYVPAQGSKGGVACLSGRTAAYRRSVILPVVENLENEFFLGRRCVAGDDGRLTWLVLSQGYKTVHQSSARAVSMFPDSFRAFFKQRIRWSRNSYRCYLTALWKGWLWKTPFVTKVTVLQILLTPVTMGITLSYLVFSRILGNMTPLGIGLAVGWVLLGRGIRGWSHLKRHPGEILLLPLTTLVIITISLPIKLYAFITMNKQGWLTRSADQIGGAGQTAGSLRGMGVPAQRSAQVPGPARQVSGPPSHALAPISGPAHAPVHGAVPVHGQAPVHGAGPARGPSPVPGPPAYGTGAYGMNPAHGTGQAGAAHGTGHG